MESAVELGRLAIERWYRAALDAVDPEAAVTAFLSRDDLSLIIGAERVPAPGRLAVVAVGKAALPMARAAARACGDLVSAGIVLTKDGHAVGAVPDGFEVFEASHPIPDERGVAATRKILDLVAGMGPGDVVLALISGGGSALLEAPRPPLTLSDMAETTAALLKAGAPIQHLNAVRTPLSLVKGGGLRAAAPDARFVTLVLSDVLSNDPRVIASGPTIPAALDAGAALSLLEQYRVDGSVPAVVVEVLALLDGKSPAAPATAGDVLAFAGDNDLAVKAMAAAAAAEGMSTRIAWRRREGEASDLGRRWIELALAQDEPVAALFGGGEATVTVRGGGQGGRNTEFALAAALELDRIGDEEWLAASLATDGQDALTGVAGAIVDGGTVARASAAGTDPAAALAENDSLAVFRAAGGIVAPGPTGTNVNDLYVALRIG